ncbi:transmembrane protein 60-like [Pristis pectinata]|uniref:transmembrane protein 60-like n=1 Tax=Pristis pectinata TaxID=685728 RepID=UPI00223D15C4|nr:transmembrane protein 60-like [Pristis pectinata]XP_051901687.1 transmembrane protein 60-like [Pristis pectinata]XP_051901688.1 transmembrane protein 60-like [Pristis pectinata]XP_051901689.1 transmembrane protein 60-like [Pristis pectinata]XP_051901690.1 transmembrane protein 60-like [Pristis pectinata]XP_051901691.1 transmembrane protein 60-like [Pristis pectinata]XP_051901692.1 transmembrane protein 60-like [Pristis pectinata]XP_051901693.1 transmembrane protein 60-like [Pristis pectin
MSLAQRVLLTWLFGLLFLIVLVLKMEETLGWSWFLVFVPLWLLDAALLVLLLVQLAGQCRAAQERGGAAAGGLKRRAWGLCALLLKLAFLLALAARLQRLADLPLCWVLVPLWLLLLGAIGDMAHHTFAARPE